VTKEYHSHKDHDYWTGVKWDADYDKPAKVETAAQPKPAPVKPASKSRVKSFTMVENGELIGISMLVSNEVVRINGMMV
jgi:hypothetical protein